MRAASSLLLCLLIGGAGVALAQTSGETNSRPDVLCGQESGAAARACNEYCKTLTCHHESARAKAKRPPGVPAAAFAPKAPSPACEQAKERFEGLTGRQVPCEELVACPCYDPQEWADSGAGMTWRNLASGSFKREFASCTADTVEVELELDFADSHPRRAAVDVSAPECRVFDGNARAPEQILRINGSEARICSRVLRRAGGSLCQ